MNYYNPFDVPFSLITTENLKTLRDVSEGWYVEYKQQVPNPSSIAKSISAFANTYGGWLFYGIKEKSKEEPVAGEFLGFKRSEIDGYLNRIRQSVTSHVTPAPHFDMKILWGPLDQLSLRLEQAIICIWIPWSPRAPHIHKSGVIYRRIADSSEPVPENDRNILSDLFKRSDNIIAEYKNWIGSDPDFTEDEKRCPYLRLFIVADPWKERDPYLDLPISDIKRLFKPDGIETIIPFNSIQTTSNGFLARQLASGNDASTLTIAWHLDKRLCSEVLIPIPLYLYDNVSSAMAELNEYKFKNDFIGLLSKYKFNLINILDTNLLFLSLMGVIEINRRILSSAKWNFPYYVNFKILNANRCIPFLDIEEAIVGYEKFGIPFYLTTNLPFRNNYNPDSFIKLKPEINKCDDLSHSKIIFFFIASSLGIPIFQYLDKEGKFMKVFSEALEAAERAIKTQKKINVGF